MLLKKLFLHCTPLSFYTGSGTPTPSRFIFTSLFLVIPAIVLGSSPDADTSAVTLEELAQAEREVALAKANYQREVDRIQAETFRVMGTVKDRIGNYLVLWGVAIPQDEDFSKMGAVVNEGNIEVAVADPEAIYANSYGFNKTVYHRYMGKDYGTNVFGTPVPVYIYGPAETVPEEIDEAYRVTQTRYAQLLGEYLSQKETLIRSIYDAGYVDRAKEVFLEVLATEAIPATAQESWKARISSWLTITDEEIEKGKVGTVLAQEYVDRAGDAISRSKFDEAMALISRAGKLDPDHPDYNVLMGAARAGKAKVLVDQAEEAYKSLLYFRAQTLLKEAYGFDPSNETIPLLNRKILKKRKSPVLAATFSLLPGAGQFYNHQTWKGVFFSATYIGFAAAFINSRMKMESKWDSYLAMTDPDAAIFYYDQAKSAYDESWIYLACVVGVTTWSMLDSYWGAGKYNDQHFLNDWEVGFSLRPAPKVDGVMIGLKLNW